MAQDTKIAIEEDLKKRYKKQALSVNEVAKELGVSSTTVRTGVKTGLGVPQFRRVGGGTQRKKTIFPIHEVAKFLADTQQVY